MLWRHTTENIPLDGFGKHMHVIPQTPEPEPPPEQRAPSDAIVPTVFHCGPFAERTTLTAIIHVNECVVFRSFYIILVHYFWLFIIYFSSNLYAVSHTVDFMLLSRRYFFLSVLFSAAGSHASALMTISTQTQYNERTQKTSNKNRSHVFRNELLELGEAVSIGRQKKKCSKKRWSRMNHNLSIHMINWASTVNRVFTGNAWLLSFFTPRWRRIKWRRRRIIEN